MYPSRNHEIVVSSFISFMHYFLSTELAYTASLRRRKHESTHGMRRLTLEAS